MGSRRTRYDDFCIERWSLLSILHRETGPSLQPFSHRELFLVPSGWLLDPLALTLLVPLVGLESQMQCAEVGWHRLARIHCFPLLLNLSSVPSGWQFWIFSVGVFASWILANTTKQGLLYPQRTNCEVLTSVPLLPTTSIYCFFVA